MATCNVCQQSGYGDLDLLDGVCAVCRQRIAMGVIDPTTGGLPAKIMLTTETAPDIEIDERLEIVTAEVVFGMNLFKDIASALRDTFGGRTETMETAFRNARKTALAELTREAVSIGANAVIAIDLDYSEISGGGRSMLFLVASGTAVRLSEQVQAAAE